MLKARITALILVLISVAVGFFVYTSQVNPNSRFVFKLGLDLNGGTHLTYHADTTKVQGNIADAMNSLREVIERRVNLFGVSEPLVLVEEQSGTFAEHRLIVELPGVTDVSKAVALIGKTPLLEFKIASTTTVKGTTTPETIFLTTGLTGNYLEHASLEFDSRTNEPLVSLKFNDEGKALFAKITKANVNNVLAIFLDNAIISAPVVRQEIADGKAQISGAFDVKGAQALVRDLNYGALPVPIELISTQTVGPSLGEAVRNAGVRAGIIAFIVISLFLILWYRIPGLIAVVALAIYVVLNLALFKLIPVTLTAAGIAAFILSLGMAVDANILIFERTKEELKKGKPLEDAIREGFARAWLSIRDSNLSSIITGVILFYFASTSVVKGFALVFIIGVLTSMFTAITASRTFLFAARMKDSRVARFLFSSGIK